MPHYKNPCADECENKCQGKDCCLPCCAPNPCVDRYSASEICCKKRAAVVTISSQWMTTDQGFTGVPGVDDIKFMRLQGSGAFVDICKRRYILTSSALVQIPPSVLAVNDRYPTSGVEQSGFSPSDIVAASRILVTVRDLNGRAKPARKCEDGHTFVYEACPAFVDGAGGWALLYIDMCKEWNRCLPHIEDCHPCFELGKSRKLNCGDDLYLLGDWGAGPSADKANSTGFGITCGVVSKHRAADHSGWAPAELIWGDFEAYHPTLGCPIVNQFAELVGVQYANVPGVVDLNVDSSLGVSFPSIGSGGVAGISTFFMEYGLKCFSVIGSRKRRYDCYRRHLGTVMDSYHGDYYKYLKGFIGIAYQLVEASDYNTRLGDPATGERYPLINNAASGGLYEGPRQKNLAGIRVENVAGFTGTGGASVGDVTYVQVAGATGYAGPFFDNSTPASGNNLNSNFVTSLTPETIVTAGEDCYFGDESKQIAPALLTWKHIGGDRLNLVVRRPVFEAPGSLVPTELHLRDSNSVAGQLLAFPSDYDYPWACVNSIPLPLITQNGSAIGFAYPPVMTVSGFKPAI